MRMQLEEVYLEEEPIVVGDFQIVDGQQPMLDVHLGQRCGLLVPHLIRRDGQRETDRRSLTMVCQVSFSRTNPLS